MKAAMRIAGTLAVTVLLLTVLQAYGSPQERQGASDRTAADTNPAFEVATIKPSDPNQPGWTLGTRGTHFFTINTNMIDLISFAYGLHAKQIVGGPAWFLAEKFDIEGVPNTEVRPSREQLMLMVQKLLTDRFRLTLHHEKRELAVYVLRVGKNGSRLTKSAAAPDAPSGYGFPQLGLTTQMKVMNMTVAGFASAMQRTVLDKPVVDQTGLTEKYDFTLNWTPDDSQFIQFRGTGVDMPSGTDSPNAPPGLYTAIQEQLGLKLEPVKALDDVVVIDRVERPSAN
jgi:uncharacterized protein (TIGR03435 family)